MPKKIKFVDYSKYFDSTKVISESEAFKKNEFTPKGIYSEDIFGNYYDENNDITKKGWIKLNYPLIQPLLYLIMKNKKVLTKDDEKDLMSIIKSLKEDPVKFFEDRRNSKTNEIIDFILKNKKFLLINEYPVYSHTLRPVTVIGGARPTLIYDKINNYFSLLIEYNNTLGPHISDKNFDNNDLIFGMQEHVNTITQFVMGNVLSKKQGVLRKEILGARINHSSRTVITPLTGEYEIDDVSLPYIVGTELYKYQILNILTKVKGINYNQALKIHEQAQLHFDPEIYSIMMSLVKKTKGGLQILLNRNPTISIGSILLLRVANIKNDITDATLSISNNILAPFAGDYDGDVLNIIALHDNYLKESMSFLSPRNLIINKEGVVDRRFSFIKEQNLGIWQLNNI